MAEKIKVNFALLPETVERMKALERKTYRSPGRIIDWLVGEAYKQIAEGEPMPDDWKPEALEVAA